MAGGISLIGLAIAAAVVPVPAAPVPAAPVPAAPVPVVPVPVVGAGPVPHPGIMIFWATWCAPCRAELARIPALAAAARPMPVVILAIDPPEVARKALDGKTGGVPAFADARPPAEVLAQWGGPSPMMPLAVALDAAGHVCARKHGLLGTDQLHAWAAQCSR